MRGDSSRLGDLRVTIVEDEISTRYEGAVHSRFKTYDGFLLGARRQDINWVVEGCDSLKLATFIALDPYIEVPETAGSSFDWY